MNLGPKARFWLGVATAWPALYFVLFLVIWLLSFFGMAGMVVVAEAGAPEAVFPMFGAMFVLFGVVFVVHALTMLEMLGLLVFYVVHVVKNAELEDSERVLWIVLVILAGFVGQGVYYWMKIRPGSESDALHGLASPGLAEGPHE